MNNLPREKLGELIATYGRDLCDEPRKVKALLTSLCGEHKREINVLIAAQNENIPADLLAKQSTPTPILLPQLTKRLRDNWSMAEEAAQWAVESWALALGVVTQTVEQREREERQRREREEEEQRKRFETERHEQEEEKRRKREAEAQRKREEELRRKQEQEEWTRRANLPPTSRQILCSARLGGTRYEAMLRTGNNPRSHSAL